MTLQVVPAEPRDLHRLVDIYFAAFQNPMALACFPDTAPVRSWWTAELKSDIEEGRGVFLKVVEAYGQSADGETRREIIAFAQWHPPVKVDEQDAQDDEPRDWPEGGDHKIADEFFEQVSARHKEIMGREEHWYLEIIATAPEHQRKGAASMLLSYACSKADETGHKCYLEASPASVSTYRRFGFEQRGRVSVMVNGEEYPNDCMVREPRKGS